MAGLLDWITEKAKAQYAKGAPYREAVGGLLQGDMNKVNQALSKSDLTPMDFATTFAPLGITAWHGAPDIFNKFDMSKIGSANGAAYGHGINIAEAIPTAEYYKNMNQHNNVDLFDIQNKLNKELNKTELHPDIINKISSKSHWFMENPELVKKYTSNDDALKAIIKVKDKYYNPSNSLYKIDLPDENLPYMMDWHLPLSKQTKEVQSLLPKDIVSYAKEESGLTDPTGQAIYLSMGNNVSSAKKLNELGIKGTRFKDTMSSTPEQRFNNYTIFDPNTIKILERNGLLLP